MSGAIRKRPRHPGMFAGKLGRALAGHGPIDRHQIGDGRGKNLAAFEGQGSLAKDYPTCQLPYGIAVSPDAYVAA